VRGHSIHPLGSVTACPVEKDTAVTELKREDEYKDGNEAT